jgi:hypothetical protein
MAIFVVVTNFIRDLRARLTFGSGDKIGEALHLIDVDVRNSRG